MPELQTLGKYQILEEIGRGGFATVYRARDARLHREVALKILNPVLGADQRFVELFYKEAQIAAGLKHPNIVTIYEADQFEQRLYIAMELLPGLDLRRRVERDGPLPLPLVVSVIEQMAQALAYAHRRGIVHRDVKSANILVDDQGRATLTDFGLVRAVEGSEYGSSIQVGGFVGTAEYISPEQAEGQPATAQSDLYSLGIVAYEMATGRAPFKADTPLVVIRMQADKPPRDPRELRPDLPEGMAAALLRALAKKPTERQANVVDLAAELRGGMEQEAREQEAREQEARRKAQKARPAQQGQPARAAQPGAGQQPALPPWVLALGGLFVVCLIVAAIGGKTLGNWEANAAATQTAAAIAALPTSARPTPIPLATAATAPTLTPAANQTPKPPAPTSTLTQVPISPTPGLGATRVFEKDGMVQVYVPAGEFMMGSADSDKNAADDEKPQHPVSLDAFWIDKTEVTNAMFARFVDETGHKTEAEKEGGGWAWTGSGWGRVNGADWRHPRGPDTNINGLDDHPVVLVSWNDANAYCTWAGRQLPTEAQWEKAARWDEKQKRSLIYPWGDEFEGQRLNFCDKNCPASWKESSVDDGYEFTAPVGSYPAGASPYGVLDMAGNVWEWVADWYAGDYYASSPASNPQGPSSGDSKVLRGGAWYCGQILARPATRVCYPVVIRNGNVGFRCVAAPPGQ